VLFCIIYKHALFILAGRQTGPAPPSISGTPACQDQRVSFFSFPLGNKLIYLLRLALFQDLSATWLPNMYYFTSQFYLPRSKTWVKIHSSEQWFMLGAGIEIDSMHPTMPLTWKYCWRYWATTLMLKVTVVTSECWSCWDLRRALVPMCEATMLHIYLLQAQKLVLPREIFYP
jgi:hypothetical protein